MATGYIYNALKAVLSSGEYETRENPETGETEYGVNIPWAGREWWFPYGKVTAIPNYALCEVDHDKSTPNRGEAGTVIYQNIFLDGTKVAFYLTEATSSTTEPNKDRGLHVIEGKPTGKEIVLYAGSTAETRTPIFQPVMERVATKAEIERAEESAKAYKEKLIADYFDSKRQRMTGGQGKHVPDNVTKTYMKELGVTDIDDIAAHQKSPDGMTPAVMTALIEAIYKGQEVNGAKLIDAAETARRRGKTQLTGKKKSLNLAANKAQYDAEHAEEEVTTSTE